MNKEEIKKMKKTKKPEPERVLKVIERLCYIFWDSPETLKDAKKIISGIYSFAHLYSGCKAKHADWIEEFYKIEERLKGV